MPVHFKPRWALPERTATPEGVFRNRRAFLKTAGIAAGAIAAGPAHANIFDRLLGGDNVPTPDVENDPSAGLYPAPRNEAYQVMRPISDENLVTTYNNFYEFGSHKRIFKAAQKLQIRPWTVTIDGMVEKEQTLDIDTLLRKMSLEERVYRHRCVEAWSMVVPWTGFPMADLVALAKPLSGAKYIRTETFMEPDIASGQRQSWYPWPYVEGLTMEEATNPLAFLVTGAYGAPIEEQNGAPLRMALPWKYGFKSAKSLVRFTFTDERPSSFWMDIAGAEYGFWANVNPEVAHARWSQATEQPLGSDERIPTLLYNGYADEVAGLYADKEGERLYY
ncbi:protein-methionine-sulfoxide reductase catalytic subunit MsrP [Acuticoccus sp. MNP-M23]|uniref:protein-methionine-sulfoxide reductase catalytic subunit MsrP n=1 Tax=Acuticoccus sp. MNP-M23 TaxID=3072793 RepID=UPI002815530C|nr:protein-methionine-sulfoxide reductase catalytic subunit MsrP [Acuticoccus sp. MNP-M23]WMS44209.1 protein-methionine-sulfoxide reductase catalytic subunit MsrP [Acuticoccus sp. MNP-M23]